jgi:hypothetical protein
MDSGYGVRCMTEEVGEEVAGLSRCFSDVMVKEEVEEKQEEDPRDTLRKEFVLKMRPGMSEKEMQDFLSSIDHDVKKFRREFPGNTDEALKECIMGDSFHGSVTRLRLKHDIKIVTDGMGDKAFRENLLDRAVNNEGMTSQVLREVLRPWESNVAAGLNELADLRGELLRLGQDVFVHQYALWLHFLANKKDLGTAKECDAIEKALLTGFVERNAWELNRFVRFFMLRDQQIRRFGVAALLFPSIGKSLQPPNKHDIIPVQVESLWDKLRQLIHKEGDIHHELKCFFPMTRTLSDADCLVLVDLVLEKMDCMSWRMLGMF